MSLTELYYTQKKVGKIIWKYQLIKENDRIVVGLSGGQDSYVLLHILANIRKRFPSNFDLVALHVDVENIPYHRDYDYMQRFCDEIDVNLYFKKITIDLEKDPSISTCFKCSWNRRTEMFKFVNQNNFNKLALGHNLDDAVETLLMNMFYNAEISSMPYSVEMFKGKFQIIRPMLELEKYFIRRYAKILQIPNEPYKCPYAKVSKRHQVNEILEKLSSENKDIKKNVFRSMKKIVTQYLPQNQ